jgi:acyl CoA:acetate/3-ketoacid CoA transferase
VLREVAPGIDVAKQILPLMEFTPAHGEPRLMHTDCFQTS